MDEERKLGLGIMRICGGKENLDMATGVRAIPIYQLRSNLFNDKKTQLFYCFSSK
ncbi:hypothetical protein NIE88_19150 [Sporolactobacillus shoreicorticis]|uniref:Uncharacterized protein n=1 Tax=Sporolactobacillus shoreicorticis TaxID=1923877 RepID=A0ABW5S2G9_9BACL|nr:hypothetical protein [Sporolactobacillus shoreicorticis]MCO7127866.1 hypothetical protein [Sporolactobacillus shoreicorticis]